MDTGTCPRCGLSSERWENGVSWLAYDVPAPGSCEERAAAGSPTSAASEALDRVMNWLVGVLLVAGVAALVVLQAHPPQ
ncbi:MAG TPA: hypothetical protein VG013_42235 [Gemmataceae bacterium]|jgi:hypothetical protein|nr:hypothetical protein [Gemmataceae bacterium]